MPRRIHEFIKEEKAGGQTRVGYEYSGNAPGPFLVPFQESSTILTTPVSGSTIKPLNDDAKISPFNYGDLLWIGLIATVAIWAFLQSYQKWLHPIIDAGRDLYIPEELLNGKKLYRDIVYIYPPLAPYLLSSITWMFGNGLSVYTVVSIIISAIVVATLYFTARTTTHQIAAGLVSLLFVTLNFTGASHNFIFPYAYAATFGITFFLLYLAFIIAYLFIRRPFYYFPAFTFGFLAAWTKIEHTFSVAVTLITIFIIYKLPIRYLLYSLLIGTGSFVAVSLLFRDTPIGHHWLWNNALPHFLLTGPIARSFFARVFGIEELSARLTEIISGVFLITVSTVLIAGIDRLARGLWLRVRWQRFVALALLLTALMFSYQQLGIDRFFRAWALLQILLIPLAISSDKRSPLFVLLLFSLCGSIRIYFNLTPVLFGITLILPVYLLIVYVLFRCLPERGAYSTQAAWLWIPLFLLMMIQGQIEQAKHYALKAYPIDTAQGRFYDSFGGRAAIIRDFLGYLNRSHYSGLVVMPEGVALNYFARIENPLSFNTFTPPETADPGIEQRIIREIEEFKPELVAINNRDVSEFGYKGFGMDYDRNLIAYLQKHYLLLRLWDSPSFKLALLQRARD